MFLKPAFTCFFLQELYPVTQSPSESQGTNTPKPLQPKMSTKGFKPETFKDPSAEFFTRVMNKNVSFNEPIKDPATSQSTKGTCTSEPETPNKKPRLELVCYSVLLRLYLINLYSLYWVTWFIRSPYCIKHINKMMLFSVLLRLHLKKSCQTCLQALKSRLQL